MGRISRSLTRRRVFVGVLALGALALAACAPPPLKDEAPPGGGVPELCIPTNGGPVERVVAEPEPEPDCLPICPPREQVPPNETFAQRQVRCVEIPVFCLPGQEGDPSTKLVPGEPLPQRCTPLCVLIPPGFPGACEEVPPETR